MRWRWLIVPVPVLLAVVVPVLVASDRLRDPLFYLRFDLVVLALGVGLLLSASLALVLAEVEWLGRERRRGATASQAEAADDRRRFLRRLDHELKNPLMAMRAGLVNLAEVCTGDAQRELLSSVENQVLRLSNLSAGLRKLAELEAQPVERAPVDVGALLQEAVSLSRDRPEAESRTVTLTVPRAPWPLPAVPGEEDLLLLAVYNLLDNALKFTPPGGTVEVRAYEDGTNVVVEVADTGPGIAEEEVPHVWDELYRGEGAPGVPGSGLGLALVRAVVARHGGQAALRSRLGQGTVVTLRLPTE